VGVVAESEARLLVVDDEQDIRELLAASLRFSGFEVFTADNGREALDAVTTVAPDLVVLDVMMPGIDGLGVVRRLRERGDVVPVILLTARDSTEDRVLGLTIGSDDYITKPFSLEEVLARVRAVLRRAGPVPLVDPRGPRVGDLILDEDAHEVWKGDRLVELSPTEFSLLRYLMHNAGRVLSKAQILDHVWAYDFAGDTNVVESYISYLRKKLDTEQPRLIHTVRGVGYVIREPRATG
jgi:two-component system OmpR family response regulator